MSKLYMVILSLVAIPVHIVCHGLALCKLWEWFIAGTFGVPVLTLGESVGFALVAIFLQPSKDSDSDEDEAGTLVTIWLKAIFRPAFFVFFGWLYVVIFF